MSVHPGFCTTACSSSTIAQQSHKLYQDIFGTPIVTRYRAAAVVTVRISKILLAPLFSTKPDFPAVGFNATANLVEPPAHRQVWTALVYFFSSFDENMND